MCYLKSFTNLFLPLYLSALIIYKFTRLSPKQIKGILSDDKRHFTSFTLLLPFICLCCRAFHLTVTYDPIPTCCFLRFFVNLVHTETAKLELWRSESYQLNQLLKSGWVFLRHICLNQPLSGWSLSSKEPC